MPPSHWLFLFGTYGVADFLLLTTVAFESRSIAVFTRSEDRGDV